MKKIVLLSRKEDVEHLVKGSLLGSGEVKLITSSIEVASRCDDFGLSCLRTYDYYDTDDIHKISVISERLADGWHEATDVKEVFPELRSYRGVPIVNVIFPALCQVITLAVKSMFVSQRIIDKERPDLIVRYKPVDVREGGYFIAMKFNYFDDSLEVVARREGIPVEMVEPTAGGDGPVPSGLSLVASLRSLPGRALLFAVNKVKGLIGGSHEEETLRYNLQGALENGAERRVVYYGEGRHGDVNLPFLRALIEDNTVDFIPLTQDMSCSCIGELESIGARLFDPETLLTEAHRETIKRESEGLAERWGDFQRGSSLRSLGSSEVGSPIWELVAFQFNWLFTEGFKEIMKRVTIAELVMDRLSPAIMLTAVDTSAKDICWINVAKSKSVTTITQIHGVLPHRPVGNFWLRFNADRHITAGPKQREWIINKEGCAPEDLIFAGYPYFEDRKEIYDRVSRDEVLSGLGLSPDKPVVMILTTLMSKGAFSINYRSIEKIFDGLSKALADLPDYQVIFRGHPADDAVHLNQYCESRSLKWVRNPDQDLTSLLKAADVVIGYSTTAVIEAMVLSKPVIFFNYMMFEDLVMWSDYVDIEVARSPGELTIKLGEALDDDKRAEIIKRQEELVYLEFGPVDGRSVERVVEFIKGSMDNNPSHVTTT